MFGFEEMFDFNHDGELDSMEKVAEFMIVDEMASGDILFSDHDDADVFGDAGLDPDEYDF